MLELEAEVTSAKQAREAAERDVQAREHAVAALQQQVADAEKVCGSRSTSAMGAPMRSLLSSIKAI